ncbi:MAG: Ku protein [Thermoanaerobaculia bacterium]
MALRPTRSATITFGLVSIPVRFYTATRQEDISFNLLHQECGTRVNRKWWCAQHERIVDNDDLIRGYEISKGRYVTFSDEELKALESGGDRALEITEFVSLDQVDPVFFEKSYFLGPADGASRTYALLATALRDEGKVALARWVHSNREQLVLLRPYENGLILHTMYYADEVRDFGRLEIPETEVREKELRLATMLIGELTEKEFDPLRYHDEYRARVLEQIEAKAAGQEIITQPQEAEKVADVVDIMEALRRSLGEAKPEGRRGAKRAPSRKRSKTEKPETAKKGGRTGRKIS